MLRQEVSSSRSVLSSDGYGPDPPLGIASPVPCLLYLPERSGPPHSDPASLLDRTRLWIVRGPDSRSPFAQGAALTCGGAPTRKKRFHLQGHVLVQAGRRRSRRAVHVAERGSEDD